MTLVQRIVGDFIGLARMDVGQFQLARAKAGRARKHIAELESEFEAYAARRPWVIVMVEGTIPAFGHTVVPGFVCRERPSADLGLILGDAIHNLRVALDVLVNETLEDASPKNASFPFSKTEAGLERQIKAKMKDATNEAKALVRELKPYPGGNDVLCALHDLDIADKHREPLTIGHTMSSHPVNLAGEPPPGWPGAELLPFDSSLLPPDFQPPQGMQPVGLSFPFEYKITFAEGLPLSGQPAPESLSNLATLVDEIVGRFETSLLKDRN